MKSMLKMLAAAVPVALPVACAIAAGAAHADGLYVGGSVGSARYDGTGANGLQVDRSSTAVKGQLGYAVTPNVAIEVGAVDLGKLNGPASNLKAGGVFVDAVGTVPIASQWSLLGRVGAFDGKLRDSLAGSQSHTALKVGAGVQYDVSANVAVRGEWERYRFDALNMAPHSDLYSVGVNYRF